VVGNNQGVAEAGLDEQTLQSINREIKAIRAVKFPPRSLEDFRGPAVGSGRQHEKRSVAFQYSSNRLQGGERVAHLLQGAEEHACVHRARQIEPIRRFQFARREGHHIKSCAASFFG
jgi:hypothetical protein